MSVSVRVRLSCTAALCCCSLHSISPTPRQHRARLWRGSECFPTVDMSSMEPAAAAAETDSGAGRVLVVGSGVFGLSTAIALRRRFISHERCVGSSRPSHCYSDVLVLEASTEAVSPLAASNDLNRIVRADYGADELYTELALAAIDGWHRFNARHCETVYSECGVLLLTEQALEAERYEHGSYEAMRRRGVAVERLRAADGSLGARFPLHAQSGRYTDGYFNPRGGFVDNGRATQLLSQEALQLGVSFRRGVHCLELLSTQPNEDGKVALEGVRTSAGELHADLVVLCCGAWTPSLVSYTSALLRPSAQPVVYLSPPAALSTVLSAASFPVCAASLAASGVYFFPLSARPLLDSSTDCGGCVVKVAHHGPGLTGRMDPSGNRQCPPAVSKRLVSHIQSAMPVLASCAVVAEKVCFYWSAAAQQRQQQQRQHVAAAGHFARCRTSRALTAALAPHRCSLPRSLLRPSLSSVAPC